jgi:hypothetical protein
MTKRKNDKFRRLLRDPPSDNWPYSLVSALSDVGDTCYACKLWFESHKIPFTGADVVAMATLVMQREDTRQSILDKMEAEPWRQKQA